MDILGSALTSPSVCWTFSPVETTTTKTPQKGREVTVKEAEEDLNRPASKWISSTSKRSLSVKIKKLFRRGDPSEREPLIHPASRHYSSSPLIPRDKLKSAGKRIRKALHRSIIYMAAGMENMGTGMGVWVSTSVPNPMYYHNRNNYYGEPYY